MFRAKLLFAKTVSWLIRLTGRGGGTSLPGKLLLRLDPEAIERLSGRLSGGSVVISATNGKTTTAALLAAVLERSGERIVHNSAGANMAGGVATALLGASTAKQADGELGLFEVDEFWLDRVVLALKPRAILLANLFRDQLDRYGELETIAERWAQVVAALPSETTAVLNADDPLVADLGRERANTLYFGIEDDGVTLPGLQHAADSKTCRRCGANYAYEAIYLGHLGRYSCPSCGARRPRPTVVAEGITLDGIRGSSFTVAIGQERQQLTLPLPGLYNVYNALAAAALCSALGRSLGDIAAGVTVARPAFGRAETVAIGERELTTLLVKNPAGANEVVRTLTLEDGPLELLVALNDNTADGRDVSWIWDVDFELLTDRVGRVVCTGTRAAEIALRLKYAGVDRQLIEIEDDLERALNRSLAADARHVFALPTYTALLELRRLLTRRGVAPHYWEEREQ